MGTRFFDIIEKDLKIVDNRINKFFTLKAGNVSEFAHVQLGALDKELRPALVILSSRLFNSKSAKEISLATVVQLIHLASNVHLGITERDTSHMDKRIDRRDGSQYPVLIGDYLYGRFFQLLCDANILEMLHPLSEIICEINEGSIIRKEFEKGSTESEYTSEVIQKESATLIAGACRLGATIAGALEAEQKILHRFGLAFGMAYGLINHGKPFKEAEAYLDQALEELKKLPDSLIKNYLVCFIKKMASSKMALNEVMVV